MMIQLDLI